MAPNVNVTALSLSNVGNGPAAEPAADGNQAGLAPHPRPNLFHVVCMQRRDRDAPGGPITR